MTKNQKRFEKVFKKQNEDYLELLEYPTTKLGKWWWDMKDKVHNFFRPYIIVRLFLEKTVSNKKPKVVAEYFTYIAGNVAYYSGLTRKARYLTYSEAKCFKKLQGGVDDKYIFMVRRKDYFRNYGTKDSFEEWFIKKMKKTVLEWEKFYLNEE